MNEYTYNHIKKNKRHTFSILVAVTIASALLCSLCIFIFSYWQAQVTSTIDKTGNWHTEFGPPLPGDELVHIIENPQVESVMIKGPWVTAQLSDTKRPYFLMRGADKNFWNDMNLKNTLVEGRIPEREGEIVVSKLFFTENPSYNVGDVLILPIGNRMLGDEVMQTQAYRQDGESFTQTGTETYTIVGIIDVSGGSAHPGYITMGYYDHANVGAADELTVYLRLVSLRKVYDIMPEIVQSVGFPEVENGQYATIYNTTLLDLYGIHEKGQLNIQFIIITVAAAVLILLVMGTFVLIIYNAFSLSANSRIMELSILKSLGATPKQIKHSVLYEGFLLWALQSPLGILTGYLFSGFVFSGINEILTTTNDYQSLNVSFSWIVVLFSLAISLLTVLISASIPARKMSKIPAVEGINQNNKKVKKDKPTFMGKALGIEYELALKQFKANKKSLRIAVISLSLCLILIASYVNIISIYNLAESKNVEITNFDMSIDLNLLDEPNREMIQEIVFLPEVQDSVVYRRVRTTTNITKEQESQVFSELGGFARVNKYKYNVVEQDTSHRIVVNLVGLSDESFYAYCDTLGIHPEKFYQEKPIGILNGITYHVSANSNELHRIPMLDIKAGSSMLLYERVYDDMDTDYNFNVQIGAVTDISPAQLNIGRYSAALILPMVQYNQIVSAFSSYREVESGRMIIDLLVGDRNSTVANEKITQICSNYLASDDFSIWSLLEKQNHDALMQKAISIAVYAIAIMIGMIGIINTFSTVSNNLQLHKREYALLRSVGLTPKGLYKLFLIEGLSFTVKPIIIGIPSTFLICWGMLAVTNITWSEFMPVFNGSFPFLYTGCVFASIILAYKISSKSIRQGNIMDAIKNEII